MSAQEQLQVAKAALRGIIATCNADYSGSTMRSLANNVERAARLALEKIQ